MRRRERLDVIFPLELVQWVDEQSVLAQPSHDEAVDSESEQHITSNYVRTLSIGL